MTGMRLKRPLGRPLLAWDPPERGANLRKESRMVNWVSYGASSQASALTLSPLLKTLNSG